MSAEDFKLGFNVDTLLEEARTRTNGLDDFGEGPFLQPLGLFVDSLENEAMLNPIGKWIAKERCLGHIVNRLHYVNDRKRFPDIAKQNIEKPVFIIGFPRTGTTILHDILAQDPHNRAPLTWEVTFPSPPPQTATFGTDPRIAMCAAALPKMDEKHTIFKAMHPMGAELSQECVVMMGDAMSTPLFHNQFRVPSYQHWVDHELDWRHVYDFHTKQLQHLQSGHMLDRWVLKTGAHLFGLERMLEAYLAFARGDMGEQASPTDMAAFLQELKDDAERTGHKASVEFSGAPIVTVKSAAFKRCLANLVTNAARYARSIAITGHRDHRWLTVTIDDDGPGIPPEMIGQVFEPFFRASRARTKEFDGAGLGLTIAHEIVQRAGGNITIENGRERGLIQVVRLPAEPAPPPYSAAA